MLEKVIKYFNKEYKELKRWFHNPSCPLSKNDKKVAVDHAIARCLGVALFIQECDVTYGEVAPYFEEVKFKLLKLIEREE